MSRYTDAELMTQVTDDWIHVTGEMIALKRLPEPVSDGAGGYLVPDGSPTTLPPVRRVLAASALNVRSGNTREFFEDDEGQRYQIRYVMIGPAYDNVHKDDWFMFRGEKLKVLSVHPDQTFETRAQIIGWSSGS